MEPPAPQSELDRRVTAFAGRWLRLGEPGVGDDLVADGAPTLVSDFLLQRDGGDGLRCVAYLPAMPCSSATSPDCCSTACSASSARPSAVSRW